MASLSPRDAADWATLGNRVAEVIEPRLGPSVVANRARTGTGTPFLESLAESFGRLRGALEPLRTAVGRGEILVRTDVRDFYRSVDPDVLARLLLRAGVRREEAATAAGMLEGWASGGTPGLPVGPPASAVLANALLAEVDAVVRAPFVRWVDDYLVAVASEAEATALLERVDTALSRLGLDRSGPKTHVGRALGWMGGASFSGGVPSVVSPAGAGPT